MAPVKGRAKITCWPSCHPWAQLSSGLHHFEGRRYPSEAKQSLSFFLTSNIMKTMQLLGENFSKYSKALTGPIGGSTFHWTSIGMRIWIGSAWVLSSPVEPQGRIIFILGQGVSSQRGEDIWPANIRKSLAILSPSLIDGVGTTRVKGPSQGYIRHCSNSQLLLMIPTEVGPAMQGCQFDLKWSEINWVNRFLSSSYRQMGPKLLRKMQIPRPLLAFIFVSTTGNNREKK